MRKSLPRLLLSLGLLAAIASPTEAAEEYLCDCVWYSTGCLRYADYDPHPAGMTAHVYYNCGNGWVYQGHGLFGGCPGTATCDGGYV